MRIAVDLHGFLDSYSPVLKEFLKFLRGMYVGLDIYVISGAEKKQIIKELKKLGYEERVHYDKVFSIVDYLKKIKDPNLHQDKKKQWWTKDETWYSIKGRICSEENITAIFDDKKEYLKYMPKSTAFYHIKKEKK